MTPAQAMHAYGRSRTDRRDDAVGDAARGGPARIACPACFQRIRFEHIAGATGTIDDDQLEAAANALAMHLAYGCRVASREDATTTTTRFGTT